MKKIILSILLCLSSLFVFASEVSDLLQEAQIAYETGDVTTAIQKLDSAKSIMEKEQLSYQQHGTTSLLPEKCLLRIGHRRAI